MGTRYAIVSGLIVLVGLAASGRGGPGEPTDNPDGPPAPASAGGPERQAVAPPRTQAEAEERAKAVSARITRAFVKVEHESGRHLGGDAAVIVTADGYVVYHPVSGGGKRTFVLADGRRATGTHLGWSKAWGVGLAKLDGPGPWPHAELSRSAGAKAGQWVVSLGYSRQDPTQDPLVNVLHLCFSVAFPGTDRQAPTQGPLSNVEPVSGSATGRWFVLDDATRTAERNTPAVFDLDGRLAGVGFSPSIGGGPGDVGTKYTDASVIRALWDDLAAGKNLDEVRLRGVGRPDDRPAAALTPEVEAKAEAASVRIRPDKRDGGWTSGTIVTADGLVVTCAHGLRFVPAGTKVVVGLPDGRNAAGEIVGYNLVCDVCAVKITDPGPWPHVGIGQSTRVRPGDPCLMIGYGGVKDGDRRPRVRRTVAVDQWDSRWSDKFDFDPKTEWAGGDSGGGIFDADGRLVAYFIGERGPTKPGNYGRRVELFQAHRDEMAGPYERLAPAPAGESKTGR